MKHGLRSHPRFLIALSLATLGLATAGLASASLAQEGDVVPLESVTQELEFAQAFEPFDDQLPLFEPSGEGGAVDLSQIEPPRGPRVIAELGSGTASFYGKRFHGRSTASGEAFDMHAYTAAHRTLPFGSKVRVTNPRNGKQVIVRINDRGPFTRGREIDLSRAAAEELGLISRGHGRVELELLAE
ncbi:septal ring lytic transglycosylase RlpA family protein [Altererythrobacter sp. GH1-8]|uniref:septal ring lytic transglycosylase RlpA family protein n=1 Tax=Altererythrobacter sp. GH1-8 TaxID=3349333 RepID=UPI00374CDD0D